MTAVKLGSLLVLSQGITAGAGEEASGGMGSNMIAEKTAVPKMGAGIGMNIPAASGKYEGITGLAAFGGRG